MPGLPSIVVALLGATRASASTVVGASTKFSFTVDQNGVAWGFGKNTYGQLGIGNMTDDQLTPVKVILPANEKVIDVAAGHFHSLFLTDFGNVYGAGRNDMGQMCQAASAEIVMTPRKIAGLSGVTAIAAGYKHNMFQIGESQVKACGSNHQGQIGWNSAAHPEEAVDMILPSNILVQSIAAGYDFSYIVTDHGVLATGQNLNGQLGDGTRRSAAFPQWVKFSSGVQQAVAGDAHGLFVAADGKLVGTGADTAKQLAGVCSDGACLEPTVVKESGVEKAVAGGPSSCFMAGGLFCMGSNTENQLGVAGAKVVMSATEVAVPNVADVSIADYSHSLFTSGEQVYGCGMNSDGQLGDGSTTDKETPAAVFTVDTTPAPPLPPTEATSTSEAASPTDEPPSDGDDNSTDGEDPGRGSRSIPAMYIGYIGCAALAVCLALTLCVALRHIPARDSAYEDVELTKASEMEVAAAAP